MIFWHPCDCPFLRGANLYPTMCAKCLFPSYVFSQCMLLFISRSYVNHACCICNITLFDTLAFALIRGSSLISYIYTYIHNTFSYP